MCVYIYLYVYQLIKLITHCCRYINPTNLQLIGTSVKYKITCWVMDSVGSYKRVHPIQYVHSCVVVCYALFCCGYTISFCWIYVVYLIHILQGCFTGTGAIIWLPQCQWSNPEGYVWNQAKSNQNQPQKSTNCGHKSCQCTVGIESTKVRCDQSSNLGELSSPGNEFTGPEWIYLTRPWFDKFIINDSHYKVNKTSAIRYKFFSFNINVVMKLCQSLLHQWH